MQDILEMEQLQERDYFVPLDHPVAGRFKYPGPPISPHLLDHSSSKSGGGSGGLINSAWVYRRAPLLGEHNGEVLVELGYTQLEIDEMKAGPAL